MDFRGKLRQSESVEMSDVERELCRIPDVRATRIVTNDDGRPVEVHVLAAEGKHAKQLARDVQSVAIASFGITLDHRIISVVQLGDGPLPAPLAQKVHNEVHEDHDDHVLLTPEGQRVTVEGVTVARSGYESIAEVTLGRNGETFSADARGSIASSAILRLVAQATLGALRKVEPTAYRVDVEMATIIRFGDRAVAVTSVIMVMPPYEEVVSGSAIVRAAGDHDAVARALLDATNRRLHQLSQ